MSTATQAEIPIRLKPATPVLAVRNIRQTIAHWNLPLGFGLAWEWGEPPQFAALHRGDAWVQIKHNPDVAATAEGQEILIFSPDIDALYAEHQRNGADILSPLQPKPWGVVEYTVRELHGYHLRFAAAAAPPTVSKTLPPTLQIVERAPTLAEYLSLSEAVGWRGRPQAKAQRTLDSAAYAAIAQTAPDTPAIGCLILVPSSGSADYYLESLIVHPDWQGQRVGTALMNHLMTWLRVNAPGAYVNLGTDETLARFYETFGFRPHFTLQQQITGNVR